MTEREWIQGKEGPIACFQVPGDGSCFFHSIAVLTNYCGIRAHKDKKQRTRIGLELRRKILDAPQWNRFNKATGFTGLSPPLEKARATKYYADDFIINFSARRLGLNLLIFDEVSEDVYLFPCNKRNRPYLCFRWIKRCHFEPIADICTQGNLECPHKMSFVGDRFPYANSGFFRGIVDPKTSFLAKRLLEILDNSTTQRVHEIEV